MICILNVKETQTNYVVQIKTLPDKDSYYKVRLSKSWHANIFIKY